MKITEMLRLQGMNATLEFLLGIKDKKLRSQIEAEIQEIYDATKDATAEQRRKYWGMVKLLQDTYTYHTGKRYDGRHRY